MPRPRVQLCALQVLQQRGELHAVAREALGRRAGLAAFGALLCDLPLFASPPWWSPRSWLGRGATVSDWYRRLHQPEVAQLGVALLQPRAASRLGPLPRVALAAGFSVHLAVELELAPLLGPAPPAEQRAALQRWRSAQLAQELWWIAHLTVEGIDALPAPDAGVVIGADSGLERALVHLGQALRDTLGAAPRRREAAIWLDGLAHSSTPPGWPSALSAVAPAQPPVGLTEACERALARASRWIDLIAQAFEPGDVLPAELLALAEQLGSEVATAVDAGPEGRDVAAPRGLAAPGEPAAE